MDTAIALPMELSPQNYRDVSELAWSVTTGDARHTGSARKIAERWMDKGGDVYRRAGRFITQECLHVSVVSITTTARREHPFALLVRQLRLLAVLQYLGGQDLRLKATQQQALEALYGTAANALISRWNHRRVLFVGDGWRTCQAGRLFHRRYVAPVLPPLAPLR